MGAQLSTVVPTATVPVDAYVGELGDLMYAADLGRSARFLKTVRALHKDGQAVIKVFIKPAATVVDLGPARRILVKYSQALKDVPNAIGYKRIIETERAGYLVRQFIKHNLYDRISTRPFLEHGEKVWLAYQFLRCLEACDERNVYHGDLKSENVLVNSWKWVYVVDWAPYKPVRLPETNTAPFLFYFDTSQRRACYVAPERFADLDEPANDTNSELTAAMDIYSAGCVIAELFMDGAPLFTLADLFRYKRGESDANLTGIEDPVVKELVASMINLDPNTRLKASEYLTQYKGTLFPEYFGALYDLLMPLSGGVNSADSDGMVDHIWAHYGDILQMLDISAPEQAPVQVQTARGVGLLPLYLEVPSVGRWIPRDRNSTAEPASKTGALIILSLVCSTLRSTSSLRSRLRAAELVVALSEHVGDEARLDRSLPYLMGLARDEYDSARETAIVCVTHLCGMVSSLTTLNAKVYSEYVFPRLAPACSTASPAVKAAYAVCLPELATIAAKAEQSSPQLLGHIDDAARSLLTDTNSTVRRALLNYAPSLCSVLGRQRTNDIVLSHAITYLNDKDTQVRIALFEFVSRVAPLIGPASLEQYIIPLMIQSLLDPHEDVVTAVIKSLASLSQLGLVRPPLLLGTLIPSIAQFCIHPNPYIRAEVVLAVCGAAKHLSPARVYCLLRPHILPYLENDIADYSNQQSLIESLRPPIPIAVYNLARTWASQARKSSFWSAVGILNPGSTSFSTEDKRWLARLRDVGFNNENLSQLLAFRDYLAAIGPPEVSAAAELPSQKLDVLPTTWKNGNTPPPHLQKYLESFSVTQEDIETPSEPSLSAVASTSNGKSGTDPVAQLVINGRGAGSLFTIPESGAGSKGQSNSGSSANVPSTLVASIKAHRGTISALAAAANEQTFVTAADDGLVKVWDARSLAKGASRPVLSHDVGARATAACFIGSTTIVAVGTYDGSVHFLDLKHSANENGALVYESLESVAIHTGPAVSEESKCLTSIVALQEAASPKEIWILRANSSLERLSLGSFATLTTLTNPLEHGIPTCWAFDQTRTEWVAVGTSHGMIDMWDLRFDLRVQAWGLGELQPITAMDLHPNSGGKWICVAGGYSRSLVSMWDVQRVECREVLIPLADTADNEDEAISTKSLEPRASIAELSQRFANWRLDETFARERPPITALFASAGEGGKQVVVSGGGDRMLRYWDLGAPNQCGVISGLTYDKPKFTYTTRIGSNVKYTYERQTPLSKKPERLARTVIISNEEADIGRNHRGTITRVALLRGSRQMVVSVDEVGVVKVFV